MFYPAPPRAVSKILLFQSCSVLWRCPEVMALGMGVSAWAGIVQPWARHHVHLLPASLALHGITFPQFMQYCEDKSLLIVEALRGQDLEVLEEFGSSIVLKLISVKITCWF